MRILVTGAQGTLGKKLVVELHGRGHVVMGCDLHHGEGHYGAGDDEVRTDITEWRQVEAVFKDFRPDVCYHLAGEFGRVNGLRYYEQLWMTNCLGTRHIIEACAQYNSHLVFASSSEAYGDLTNADGILYENDLRFQPTPNFHNEYALTKFTNEKQIQTAIKTQGLKATVLRFFNVYGPGEFYTDYRSVICLFIYRAMHNLPITVFTKTVRSFLYVDDWSHVVANVLEFGRVINGDVFNIASPECVTMQTLFDLIVAKVGGTQSDVVFLDTEANNVASKMPYTGKAVGHLNMKFTVALDEGLDRTIAWMRAQYGVDSNHDVQSATLTAEYASELRQAVVQAL